MFISLLYPNICPFCKKQIEWDRYYCEGCYTKLDFIDIDKIPGETGGIIAVCAYDEAARSVVYPLKWDNYGYSAWAAARLICDRLEALGESFDVVTAVPMHKKDFNQRGYNQSALIAKEISAITGIPMSKGVVKIRHTKSQKALREAERRTNLKGAFKVRKPADYAEKRVLLIDDVCTTGSTLSEVSRTILSSGAKSVTSAVFAKTMKNG